VLPEEPRLCLQEDFRPSEKVRTCSACHKVGEGLSQLFILYASVAVCSGHRCEGWEEERRRRRRRRRCEEGCAACCGCLLGCLLAVAAAVVPAKCDLRT